MTALASFLIRLRSFRMTALASFLIRLRSFRMTTLASSKFSDETNFDFFFSFYESVQPHRKVQPVRALISMNDSFSLILDSRMTQK
jgi:hypothetical protein